MLLVLIGFLTCYLKLILYTDSSAKTGPLCKGKSCLLVHLFLTSVVSNLKLKDTDFTQVDSKLHAFGFRTKETKLAP